AQVRVHDTAVLPQLGHCAASQYFPLDHNGHPATDALDDAEVVLNHQQRDARLLNVLKVLADALDQSRVDPSHRLVEEHQFRLRHHGSSQLEKSLLPSADVARVLVTEVVEVELIQKLRGALEIPSLCRIRLAWLEESSQKRLSR